MGNILKNCCTDPNERSKPNLLQSFASSNDTHNNQFNNDTTASNKASLVNTTTSSTTNQNAGPSSNNMGGGGGGLVMMGDIKDGTGTNNSNREYNPSLEAQQKAEAERQRALHEEQYRLESIVSTAGREMVSLSLRSSLDTTGGGHHHGMAAHHHHGTGGNSISFMGVYYYDPQYASIVARDLLHSYCENGLFSTCQRMEKDETTKMHMENLVHGHIPPSCIVGGVVGEDGYVNHQITVMNVVDVLSKPVDYFTTDDLSKCIHSLELERNRNYQLLGRGGGGGSGSSSGGVGSSDMNIFVNDVLESYLSTVMCTKERLFRGVGPIVENLP